MKKSIPFSVVSILILMFTQIVATSSDVSSYDIMADINRDRMVDAEDLTRLGNAYGSSLLLPSEPNKTVVTVLSFDKEPPEVENARVAVVDPNDLDNQRDNPINVTYANSSGTATFELGSNKNYTAIAWSGSAHNYANFTTNSLGEASVLILLGEPSLPQISSLPKEWIAITLLYNDTGLICYERLLIIVDHLEYGFYSGSYAWQWSVLWALLMEEGGVAVVPPDPVLNDPQSGRGVRLIDPYGNVRGSCTFSPNENGCANVIVYVTPP